MYQLSVPPAFHRWHLSPTADHKVVEDGGVAVAAMEGAGEAGSEEFAAVELGASYWDEYAELEGT